MIQPFKIDDEVEGISNGVNGKYKVTAIWWSEEHNDWLMNAKRWVKTTSKWSGNSWTYHPKVFKLI